MNEMTQIYIYGCTGGSGAGDGSSYHTWQPVPGRWRVLSNISALLQKCMYYEIFAIFAERQWNVTCEVMIVDRNYTMTAPKNRSRIIELLPISSPALSVAMPKCYTKTR